MSAIVEKNREKASEKKLSTDRMEYLSFSMNYYFQILSFSYTQTKTFLFKIGVDLSIHRLNNIDFNLC